MTTAILQSNPDAAVDFLEWLRPSGPWNLTALPGAISVTLTDPAKVRAWVTAQSEQRRNCYYVGNPAPIPTGAAGRAKKIDVVQVTVLQADLDVDKLPEGHVLYPLPLAARKARVIQMLREFDRPGPPSVIIDSGGGLQALWRLDGDLPTTRANLDLVESLNSWLGEQFPGGDSSVSDVGHLLRLPGTVNWPNAAKQARGRVPALAAVVESNSRAYLDFEFPTPPAPPQPERQAAAGGGEISPEQLALLLSAVDPGEVRGKAWVSFSAACHSATKGAGLDDWLDWCHRDPLYADVDDDELLPRWNSWQADRDGKRAGIGTLIKAATDAGHRDLVEQVLGRKGADEFEDDLEPDLAHRHESRSPEQAGIESTYAESLVWREPKWLVEGIIPFGGMVQNYGARKSLKTFVSIDLACCIATGRAYHGQAVQRGKVTYIAAEGSRARFRDRITAWCRLNSVKPEELEGWLYMVNRPVNLTEPRDVKAFIEGLRDGRERHLIVFDTLSKNTGGVDEDTKGMKLAVNGANSVRFATGAAVLLIHHEGKDATKKGRGSTVLPGDVDLSLRTQRLGNGRCTLTVDEARDTDEGKTFAFELVEIIIGELDEVAAAVRLLGHGVQEPKSTDERVLVDIVEYGRYESPRELIDEEVEGRSKANIYKVVKRLRDEGLVQKDDPLRPTKKGVQKAQLMGAAVPDDEEDQE